MQIEPSVMVLYVDNISVSKQFYQDLLGISPEEASPAFYKFKLSNGMYLALKAKHTVDLPVDKNNGNGELAFTMENNKGVDELLAAWQSKQIPILSPPNTLCFGYTFVALDPDNNRLRVVSLSKS